MKKINPLSILLPGVLLLSSCAYLPFVGAEDIPVQAAIDTSQPFSNDDYAQLLSQYVTDEGWVNYDQLQQNRELLDRYYARLAAVTPETYKSWNRNQQLAFLLNAYNALTLLAIIEQDPLKNSIRDIPGVWSSKKFQVAGDSKTLDNIEHDVIRPVFNEPRIHAAIVCAAKSCPPLRPEPYTGEKLDAQLEDQSKKWVNNPETGFRIDRQENKVYLSKIFDWFGEDWEPEFGVKEQFAGNDKQKAALNFISNYLSAEDQAYLKAGKYEVSYLDYDWSLNKQ